MLPQICPEVPGRRQYSVHWSRRHFAICYFACPHSQYGERFLRSLGSWIKLRSVCLVFAKRSQCSVRSLKHHVVLEHSRATWTRLHVGCSMLPDTISVLLDSYLPIHTRSLCHSIDVIS